MTSKEWYMMRKTNAIQAVTGGLVGCQECGFPLVRALQFDHIRPIGGSGSGKRGRASDATRGGALMVKAILNGTQDVSELRVLCANCHCLKGYDHA